MPKRKQKRSSPAIRAQLLEAIRADAGKTPYRTFARRFGLSESNVSLLARRAGIKRDHLRPRGKGRASAILAEALRTTSHSARKAPERNDGSVWSTVLSRLTPPVEGELVTVAKDLFVQLKGAAESAGSSVEMLVDALLREVVPK